MSAACIDEPLERTLRASEVTRSHEARLDDEPTVNVGPRALLSLLKAAREVPSEPEPSFDEDDLVVDFHVDIDVDEPEPAPRAVVPPPPLDDEELAPKARRFTPEPLPPRFVSVLSRVTVPPPARDSSTMPAASTVRPAARSCTDTQRSAPVPRSLRHALAPRRSRADRLTTALVLGIWAIAFALMGTLAFLVSAA